MSNQGPVHSAAMGEVTRLLLSLQGEGLRDDVVGRIVPLVYDELRQRARRMLAGGSRPMAPTELVHEAYLTLVDQTRTTWQNRSHFLAVAARQMRRVLVDAVRAQRAQRRGDGIPPLPLDSAGEVAVPCGLGELLGLHEALERLETMDARKAAVVELRTFGGLTFAEVALVLDVSEITAKRDWEFARAWLRRELGPPKP